MPTIRSINALRTRIDRTVSSSVISRLPASAPPMIAAYPPISEPPITIGPLIHNITMATPRLAPELIPKTDGPANGLRNAVCNSSPVAASAAPPRVAVIHCGIRFSRIMNDTTSSPPAVSECQMSAAGIWTAPKKMLHIAATTSSRNRIAARMTIRVFFMIFD